MMAESVSLLSDEEQVLFDFNDSRTQRIILVGKTGAGKSAAGNNILRRNVFKAKHSPNSVTMECMNASTIDGNVQVLDTPGFCGTQKEEDMNNQIKECIRLSLPGPHAFLLVMRADVRYTDEEEMAVTFIKKNFGEKALDYTIVLFTRVDQLENNDLICYVQESETLMTLIRTCGNRYHGFNNKDMTNDIQVTQLLNKIDEMVTINKGKHYTNEMFKKAQNKFKREIFLANVKEKASNAGLVVIGGLVLAPVGALAGTVGAAAAGGAIGVAIGAAIGAGVAGAAGVVGVALGTVIAGKSDEGMSKGRDKKKD